MKKVSCLPLLILALLFISCSSGKQSALWYQNGLEKVRTVMVTEDGGRFGIEISLSDGERTITVTSPETVAGVKISSENGGCTVSVGDVAAKIPSEAAESFDTVFGAFSLSESGLCEMGKDENGDTFFCVSDADAEYTVYLDAESVPSKILINGERDLTLEVTELLYEDTSESG